MKANCLRHLQKKASHTESGAAVTDLLASSPALPCRRPTDQEQGWQAKPGGTQHSHALSKGLGTHCMAMEEPSQECAAKPAGPTAPQPWASRLVMALSCCSVLLLWSAVRDARCLA